MKLLLSLIGAAALLCPTVLHAQTTNTATISSPDSLKTGLQTLVQKIYSKLKTGDQTEADYAEELKGFDDLVAQAHGEKSEDAAQVLLAKAQFYLNIFKDTAKGKATLADLKANYPNTKAGKNVDRILAALDHKSASQKIQDGLALGTQFPDFAMTDLNGKAISVANYKGKVVLVDFWATWCGPYKAELPNVIATYQKHHANGFEIIGVSLDSDLEALDSFLKKTDGMTWSEIFNGQDQTNSLAKKYGIEYIPSNFLIGPDGKIIGKELRGEKLETVVAAALTQK